MGVIAFGKRVLATLTKAVAMVTNPSAESPILLFLGLALLQSVCVSPAAGLHIGRAALVITPNEETGGWMLNLGRYHRAPRLTTILRETLSYTVGRTN